MNWLFTVYPLDFSLKHTHTQSKYIYMFYRFTYSWKNIHILKKTHTQKNSNIDHLLQESELGCWEDKVGKETFQ